MNTFLCSILAITLVTGVTNADITLNPGAAAEMSDRDIIEALLENVVHQEKRIETLEAMVFRQNDVIAMLQKSLQGQGTIEDDDPGARLIKESDNKAVVNTPSQQEMTHGKVGEQGRRQARRTGRQVSASPVAFSSLAGHTLSHLGAGQNLIFEKTNVNTNNVYNPHHGVFTAPVPGIYLITTSILTTQNQEIHCDIVSNGIVVAQIYARGTDNLHDQGSQTILLHLKQGDDVSIQNDDLDDSIYGGLYTTFSGFLLYEEEPTPIVG